MRKILKFYIFISNEKSHLTALFYGLFWFALPVEGEKLISWKTENNNNSKARPKLRIQTSENSPITDITKQGGTMISKHSIYPFLMGSYHPIIGQDIVIYKQAEGDQSFTARRTMPVKRISLRSLVIEFKKMSIISQ